MIQLYNSFDQYEVPSLILCTPIKTVVASLPLAYNTKNVLKYNALSEFSFNYPERSDVELDVDSAYAKIFGKMLVLVENRGYYIISDITIDDTGAIPVKNISCRSLESEMLFHRLTGFIVSTTEGAFATLLQRVLDQIPTWTIGTIDSSLLTLYRSFDISNSTIYSFLTETMAKAYGAVFIFDTYHRTVSAISSTLPTVANTNIYLSYDNLIKSIGYKEITEEICTALYCYGGENLDIHYVNPLGTNVIYDFSYFKTSNWMSAGLIAALTAWEILVAYYQPIYADTLTVLANVYAQITTFKADLVDLNGQLTSMLAVRDIKVNGGLSTTEIDTQITAQRILITSKLIDISSTQEIIDFNKTSLRQIVHRLFFTSRVSFDNFEQDTVNILSQLEDLNKSWGNVYSSTSTSPNFDPVLLTTLTPTINTLFLDVIAKTRVILGTLQTGFSSYPVTESEVLLLIGYIDDIVSVLNTLYADFQLLIPSTIVTSTIDEIRTTLNSYISIITFVSNLTDVQYTELVPYIYENSYTNSNLIITDSMTNDDIQEQSQSLYDQALGILAKTRLPRYEFTGSFANFIALKDFSNFTSELDLGKVITIKKDDDTTIYAILLEISITYDNPADLSLTFSNSFRLDNEIFKYGDILGSAAQLGNNFNQPVSSGTLAGFSISEGSLSGSNAQLSSSNFLSFGQSPASSYSENDALTGAWFGYEAGVAKMSLYSNDANYLKWDGSKLLIHAENFNLSPFGAVSIFNGSFSLGSPPPTSSTSGTGIWIDETGIYGLNTGTQQFYLDSSDGTAYAGAGNVILDASGISVNIVSPSNPYDGVSAYRIGSLDNPLSTYWGEFTSPGLSQSNTYLEAKDPLGAFGTYNVGLHLSSKTYATGSYALSELMATDSTSKVVSLILTSTNGVSSATLTADTISLTGVVSSTGNITVSNITPSLILNDTTSSAKSLTMITDANLTQLRESSGASGSLLVLDLVNNSVSIGTTTSIAKGLTVNEAIFAGSNIVENNNVLSFDGNNDNINIGDITELNSVQTFSISTWINQTTVPSTGTDVIFRKLSDSNNYIQLITSNTSNRIYFYVANGSAPFYYLNNYDTYMVSGRWHHIVVTFDGTLGTPADRAKLYIDGAFVAWTGTSGTLATTTANLAGINASIGNSSSSLEGKIKRFRLYSSTLTSGNVTTLYQGTDFSTNLVHYYKIDEGVGTTVTDTGSNPMNGTISGATWGTSGYSGFGTSFPTTRISLGSGTTREDGINFGNDTWLYRSAANTVYLQGNLKISTGFGLNATPVGIQTGNIFLGLSNFGLFSSPLIPYGSMYCDDASITITIGSANVYYPITTGLSDGGSSSSFTFQSSKWLLCNIAGTYLATWSLTMSSATNNEVVAGTLMINSTHVNNTEGAEENINSGKDVSVSGSGIIVLAVNDTVSLCVENETAAHNITVTHATLSISRVL